MPFTQLPVVDFSQLSIDKVEPSELSKLKENGSLVPLAKEFVKHLQQFGFCYLKHPGISDSKANKLHDSLREVFRLPEERKRVYTRRDDALCHGYCTRGVERPKEVISVERYETFMTCPAKAFCWPDEVPDFKPASLEFYRDIEEISFRALDLLGIGLELKDLSFFRSSHCPEIGELRPTIYHRYPDEFEPTPGQMRFFEHCDLGTVALIYQDTAGGLQVKSKSGDWLQAVVIPDTVILMVGQMLQIWSSDQIKAPLHRVTIPADRESRRKDRFSVTFFPLCPDDFIFECLDGSTKYPETTVADFAFTRLKNGEFKEL